MAQQLPIVLVAFAPRVQEGEVLIGGLAGGDELLHRIAVPKHVRHQLLDEPREPPF